MRAAPDRKGVLTLQKKMTEGTIWKQIFFFSLPLMLGNLLQQLYNTVDGIVVGNYVSQDALAAVGGVFALTFLALAISMGMGGGGGIIVAQMYGAGRMSEMRRAVSTILIMLVSIGAVLSVLGAVFSRFLVEKVIRMTDANIKELGIVYFRIYALGLIVQYLYNAISSILRALGDSKSTLYFLCVTAVLNIILDLAFVLKLGWGVFGVALATVISQVVCAAVSLVYMLKRYPMFRFKREEFVFDPKVFGLSLKLGIPATVQSMVVSYGNIFMQRLINSFGAATMTAFAVGHRVESYTFIPVFSLNIGVSTFTGQNVGAGKFERVTKGLRQTLVMSVVIEVFMCVLLYTLAPMFTRLFGMETGSEATRQAIEMLHFMSFTFVLFALYQPTCGLLQGSGDAIWATISSITTLGIRVICAYLLAYVFDFGYASAWVTMPIGWICASAVTYSRILRGKWKTKAVVKPVGESGEAAEA